MLDLVDLTAFARIADQGSISEAARSLKMPKSSVSRSLARLEEHVGAQLVERSTRQLRLTEAGLLLQRHAKRLLDEVGEIEDALAGLDGKPSGDLHVNVPMTFAAGPLAAMLPGFLARYEDVRVVLAVDNKLVDLELERVDVAIRIGPLHDSGLSARRFATFELWACASPGYLKRHPRIASPADLRRHRRLSHVDRRATWKFRTPAGTIRDIELDPGTVVPEASVLEPMLVAGAGIGLLPDFRAADAIAAGALVRVLPDLEGGTVDAHAVYASHRGRSPKVRAFIDALVSHCKPWNAGVGRRTKLAR